MKIKLYLCIIIVNCLLSSILTLLELKNILLMSTIYAATFKLAVGLFAGIGVYKKFLRRATK